MLSLTIKSIRANKVRFLLTSVAIVLGVAFMAGTLVLTDTIEKSYDDVSADIYANTDAVVRSDRHIQGNNDATEVRGTVDARVLDAVRATDGVVAAEGQITGNAVVIGHDGELLDANPNRAIPIALGWQDSPDFNPMTVVAGHAPRAADEVVIDRASKRAGHFSVGETIRVIGPSGVGSYRLAGVVTYGGADDAVGAQVVAFSQATAASMLGMEGRYSSIQVAAQPGVSQAQLVERLEATVAGSALGGQALEVMTGVAAEADARAAAGSSLQFMNTFLMMFAVVALVVGAFVIYNTFSITVAQRTRETALLRAIGAKKRQVMRSVRLEAVLTGLFASAVGVVVGIGVAQALRSVLEAFGLGLPSSSTVVQPSTIVISMAIGVIVTVVAASSPARKAAKVKPIEALRDASTDRDRGSRRRSVFGALVTAAGAALVAQGLSGGAASSIGLGALAVFIGVAMLGPALARPFVRTFGSPIARGRGVAGTLARENAARNPRRTSATASALMIGLALVVLITVFASSTRASVSNTIDTAMKGDYIVRTQFGMGGMSPDVARRIDALPETGSVTPLRYMSAQTDGATKDVTALDPATVEQTVYTDVQQGSLEQLGLHDVGVLDEEAERRGLALGDTVTLDFPETGPQAMRVVAVYGTDIPLGKYAISLAAFDANSAKLVDDDVVVSLAPGVSMQDARHAINGVLADYPTAELLTDDEFKGAVAAEINQTLNLVYVLLAMALVIAFFGIANTLALSVFERTREFGLLRAVGMDRAQVRSTVRWEAVLITLLGATLGTAIGIAFSWALVQALRDQGIDHFTVPVSQVAVIVVLAAIAAVVAAVLPARRASRLDVLEALRS
jgi:putative ABC transport system permease protein